MTDVLSEADAELVALLRDKAGTLRANDMRASALLMEKAADAIERLRALPIAPQEVSEE